MWAPLTSAGGEDKLRFFYPVLSLFHEPIVLIHVATHTSIYCVVLKGDVDFRLVCGHSKDLLFSENAFGLVQGNKAF